MFLRDSSDQSNLEVSEHWMHVLQARDEGEALENYGEWREALSCKKAGDVRLLLPCISGTSLLCVACLTALIAYLHECTVSQ